jgi:hypothetical protein
MPTDDTRNPPDTARRSCVTCAHAGLNPPVNLPLVCRHPYAPNGADDSRMGTCRIMRGPLGLCGPNAAFWTQRPAPARASLLLRAWRVVTRTS